MGRLIPNWILLIDSMHWDAVFIFAHSDFKRRSEFVLLLIDEHAFSRTIMFRWQCWSAHRVAAG